ncbi:MAG: helix-turn-helix domain-containing protein [Aeromicrobium sp.]
MTATYESGGIRAAASISDERVLEFIDRQIEEEPSLRDFLRSTASFTGWSVAARARQGAALQAWPDGRLVDDAMCPPGAVRHLLGSGDESWVVTDGHDDPVAELLAEQIAVVVRTLVHRHDGRDVKLNAAESLVDPFLPEIVRASVLRGVGMTMSTRVRVLAIAGPAAGREALLSSLTTWSSNVQAGRSGRLTVAIVQEPHDGATLDVPRGCQIGYSAMRPASDIPSAWHDACLALRFTQPSTREGGQHALEESFALSAENMGSYRVLAEHLPVSALADVEDVRLIDQLIAEHGHHMLKTLDAVAATVSVREAARRLNMHHNSVAARVARVERAMGTSLNAPYGKARLFQALVLRRLKETAQLF